MLGVDKVDTLTNKYDRLLLTLHGVLNPDYALRMHSLPRGLTIRLRRMSRLNLVTLAVRVRHLSSDLTMKITNLVFLLGAKSLIFIRQLCNADSTVSIA